MANQVYNDPERRHDFAILFDVQNGNPNGDPDAGNLPRVDPETMKGIVTDVCIKRKIRNYVDAIKGEEGKFKIYVQNKQALNSLHGRAYEELGLTSTGSKQKKDDINKARQWMCQNFYDIRTFGAVMTTGVNCGQVLGPVQLTFAQSIDPIVPLDISITRIAITKPEDMEYVEGEEGEEAKGGKATEMGRKSIVPYGLYLAKGFFNPVYAQKTGFSEDDLALLWEAIEKMWDLDRSASRGFMALRGLYVFSHENKLGNAPAHKLLERVKAGLKDGKEVARDFSDYEVNVNEEDMPEGVTLTKMIE